MNIINPVSGGGHRYVQMRVKAGNIGRINIALTKGLREVADACDALMARKVEGKAVLLIGE